MLSFSAKKQQQHTKQILDTVHLIPSTLWYGTVGNVTGRTFTCINLIPAILKDSSPLFNMISGEGKSRGKPANPRLPEKWPSKWCVCVCVSFERCSAQHIYIHLWPQTHFYGLFNLYCWRDASFSDAYNNTLQYTLTNVINVFNSWLRLEYNSKYSTWRSSTNIVAPRAFSKLVIGANTVKSWTLTTPSEIFKQLK